MTKLNPKEKFHTDNILLLTIILLLIVVSRHCLAFFLFHPNTFIQLSLCLLQDICGGDRFLQSVLLNDLSGGAVLGQATGRFPIQHPN